MKRIVAFPALFALALAGCQAMPTGSVQAAAVLPDRPTTPSSLPVADEVCSDGTPVVSLANCPSAAQQRANEQRRISQTILDIHAHGG
ncbi:MAG: hypothetical protein KGN77_11345 [Xanthomonadaceae bacterium]|nr:hypothetical protein [Xanthomonadaceae bacterium]MDE1964426.1 hypothetical protein [Xanthomonadaceae bacterium]